MSAGGLLSGRWSRFLGLIIFTPSAAVLGIAGWLSPDPSGVGTHQQLGLSSCVVLDQLGTPCPMCGMTTTYSLMAHFHPIQALMTQPFGVVLFLLTVGAAALGLLEMVRPNHFLKQVVRWAVQRDRALAGLLLGSMTAGWLYKVALMRQLLPWSP